jgi:hypothetical protein
MTTRAEKRESASEARREFTSDRERSVIASPGRPRRGAWWQLNWTRVYFAAALALLVFGAGLVAALYDTAPYRLLKQARAAALDFRENALHYTRREPTKLLYPAHSTVRGVVQHDPARVMPGATLVSGFWGKSFGFRLFSESGEVLHAWNISFNEIWPNANHIDIPLHDWDSMTHGAKLYPNGDIVFNFEYAGLVRIDRNSRVLWKLPRRTHHSIYEDEEGLLWVPDRREHKTSRQEFPGMRPPFDEELILRMDPAGKIVEEISILKVIYDSKLEGVLFLGNDVPGNGIPDWLHVNDVEVLPTTLAQAFPQFSAGDIMVSARNLNLIFVIDRRTHTVKWWRVGPYLRQHDPDFSKDGKIIVFDNRRDRLSTARHGGSRILAIDPATMDTTVLFAGTQWKDFYTSRMGKLQILDNGNLLLTEAEAGRAVEVGPDGKIVWELVNRWDAKRVAQIDEATRYDTGKLSFLSEETS